MGSGRKGDGTGAQNHEEIRKPSGKPSETRFPLRGDSHWSLGQGLSIGLGMAINAKYVDRLPYRTYVLLVDSEMAEGSQWEALQLASHYRLDNLVGVLDVNRLGQRGETMMGHRLDEYERRVSAFGWESVVINGHSFSEIRSAYEKRLRTEGKPLMIIAKTIKGKGVSFLEDQEGWHGKPLKKDELQRAPPGTGRDRYHRSGKNRYP
jgi:transketolase